MTAVWWVTTGPDGNEGPVMIVPPEIEAMVRLGPASCLACGQIVEWRNAGAFDRSRGDNRTRILITDDHEKWEPEHENPDWCGDTSMVLLDRQGTDTSWAVFDGVENEYRYQLGRVFDPTNPRRLLFVGLNPSTADHEKLDPTLRRVQDYARRWGCGSFEVCNVYAYRATNPKDMLTHTHPKGDYNDVMIADAAARADVVLVGWGALVPMERVIEVRHALFPTHGEVVHLGLTKYGQPRHPLYLRATLEPTPWR